MSGRESRVDEFRRVTAAAMRAISRKPTLNSVDVFRVYLKPGVSGEEVRLPLPARDLPAEEVALTRGAADSLALRLRFHDNKLHARETAKNATSWFTKCGTEPS